MSIIAINDRLGYIEASDDPLSADVGIIKTEGGVFLYDVGNGNKNASELAGEYNVVLSHFHADHTGNIDRIKTRSLYVSAQTYRHVNRGTVVRADICVNDVHIFSLPSSHTDGCLGLETRDGFAFVGDALYSKVKDGAYVYNAQLLKEEIEVIRALRAELLLVSHYKGMIRKKEDVINELLAIYALREKGTHEIRIQKK